MSPFGYLFSVARLNNIRTSHFCSALGLSSHAASGLRSGKLSWNLLARWRDAYLGSPMGSPERRHQIDAFAPLYPQYGPVGTYRNSQLRGCRSCLRHGFHSLLHQLPWIRKCPWHEEAVVETCECGRGFLTPSNGRHPLRLLDCVCGHDHFDVLTALESPISWPAAKVLEMHEAHLREVDALRPHPVCHDYLVSLDDSLRAIVEHRLPIALIGAPSNFGRSFDSDRPARELATDEVDAIMESWQGTDPGGGFPCGGAFISLGSYRRIVRLAELVNTEARHRHSIPSLLTITDDAICLHGDVLVSAKGGICEMPRVESQLMVGARNKYVANLLTSFPRGSEQEFAAADALDTIASLAALDHLESVLHSPEAMNGNLRYRLKRQFPVSQVQLRPRLHITVALVGARRTPSLLDQVWQ